MDRVKEFFPSQKSVEEICRHFQVDLEKGLSTEVAQKRLAEEGKNALLPPKRPSIAILFFRQFSSPLIWFLLVGAVIAAFLGEWVQMSAISVIVLLNALISFFQEYSAEKSFAALQSLYEPHSKVLREGKVQEILSQDLVVGDVVVLEAGDRVPADGRVVYAAQLRTQEAALTGESEAVYKETFPLEEKGIADQKNMAFAGTDVVSGKGKLVICCTGVRTELGKIASSLEGQGKEKTPLQKRFHSMGRQLVWVCLGIISVIFFLGWWQGMDWVSIGLISLSLAVAAIPEGLPAIVTVALATGVQKMVRQKALIRRLSSVETLGCTSVICTDKTGTLTQNQMSVLRFWVSGRLFSVTGQGNDLEGIFYEQEQKVDPCQIPELFQALKIGVLCNSAHLHVSPSVQVQGDPTEGALLVVAAKAGIYREDLEKEAPFLGEIPFDSERKRMSYLRKDNTLYVKGAVEELLPLCHEILWEEKGGSLDEEARKRVLEEQEMLAGQGFRVLGLAQRKVQEGQGIQMELEQQLQLVGLVAMIDPPREGVDKIIAACRRARMIPVMITGDHKKTAVAIAQQLHLMEEKSQAIEGRELDQMDDKTLREKVRETAVFARVSAQHKLRIIEAWKSHAEVVAMTGDGVNDVPAIRRADIGVAMGITGTEVTKQVSDMVILDDQFATIVEAVKEGRAIYQNILKFIRFLLSANFAELVLIFAGMVWGISGQEGQVVTLLLPAQILWINLVTDGFPAMALVFDPLEDQVMQSPPRKLSEPLLSWSWVARLVLLGVLAACGGLWLALRGFQESVELGQTMAFTELVMVELGILFVVRGSFSLFSNYWLFSAVTGSVLLQIAVIYFSPLQALFSTVPLSGEQWLWIVFVVGLVLMAGWSLIRGLPYLFSKRGTSN